jgi:hypothetical protein
MDNIMMDLVEVGWGDVDWIGLAQDRDRWRVLVNSTTRPQRWLFVQKHNQENYL